MSADAVREFIAAAQQRAVAATFGPTLPSCGRDCHCLTVAECWRDRPAAHAVEVEE